MCLLLGNILLVWTHLHFDGLLTVLPYLLLSNQVHRARLKGDNTDVVVKVQEFQRQIFDLISISRANCLIIAGSASRCPRSDDDRYSQFTSFRLVHAKDRYKIWPVFCNQGNGETGIYDAQVSPCSIVLDLFISLWMFHWYARFLVHFSLWDLETTWVACHKNFINCWNVNHIIIIYIYMIPEIFINFSCLLGVI